MSAWGGTILSAMPMLCKIPNYVGRSHHDSDCINCAPDTSGDFVGGAPTQVSRFVHSLPGKSDAVRLIALQTGLFMSLSAVGRSCR